jgi:uncharacterized protein with NRDE domain
VCTLIFAWRAFDGTPLVAAANRDELLDRPATPPAVIDTDPTVVAPQDEEAGGTWIGYNDHGVFVGVTNRRADVEGERSRGLLVRDALARETAADAVAYVRDELAAREYAGFNLLVADAATATVLEWDGVLRTTSLDPGVHVLVNAGLDDAAEKSRRIRAALPTDTDLDSWLDSARDVLRDHDMDVCIHGDGYGTRSSSLITVGENGATYAFADGPPCRTDFADVPDGQF